MEDGHKMKIVVEARLDDECKNMHCDFSITCLIYEIKKNGMTKCVGGGCAHDEIVKHFPELKRFIPLHLCGHAGEPMYPVENGIYHIEHSKRSVAIDYLRITSGEFEILQSHTNDKEFFKYLIFKLGIVERWKKEADEFIAFLEEKCGWKWQNPYSVDEERHRLALSEDEKSEIDKKVKDGYYSEKAIAERADAKFFKARLKYVDEIAKERNKSIEDAQTKYTTLKYILDHGILLDNVIYYDHSKKVCFNWKSYDKLITQEQFIDFINNLDRTIVPECVTFEIKHTKED